MSVVGDKQIWVFCIHILRMAKGRRVGFKCQEEEEIFTVLKCPRKIKMTEKKKTKKLNLHRIRSGFRKMITMEEGVESKV